MIIWDALKPERLSKNAKKAIDTANKAEGVIFCEISLWEIAMLIRKKRLIIDVSFNEFINLISASNNYVFKGITPEIALLSTEFSKEINQDPADRIICATSILNNAALVTVDKNIRNAKSVKTIW